MNVRGNEVFSGHESFACRYGWLPKLYDAIFANPAIFSDEEQAIVTLGIGKNMVRSIRFWGDVFGISESVGRQIELTEFARVLFDTREGIDPYLEETGSLWRLHWNITTKANLGAWNIAFLEIQDLEITKKRLIDLVQQRALEARGRITAGTIAQHVDIFLRSYDAGRIQVGQVLEDTLSCPLQELGLLEVYEPNGTPTVRFLRGPKSGLDQPAFAYALKDFWYFSAPNSRSLSLRSLMVEHKSPGAVFRLDEISIYTYLEELCSVGNEFDLREDGVGGQDLVCLSDNPFGVLERIAWQ